MKKDVPAVAFLLLCLVMVGGCFLRAPSTATAVKTVEKAAAISRADSLGGYLRALASSPASGEVAKAMDGLVNAGIALFVLGGVALVLGGRTAGWNMISVGFLMLSAGVLFMTYPWVVLAVAAVAALVSGLNAYDRWRTQKRLAATEEQYQKEHKALEVTTQAIEDEPKGEGAKARILNMGAEVAQFMDEVIDPIKEKLKGEGKI